LNFIIVVQLFFFLRFVSVVNEPKVWITAGYWISSDIFLEILCLGCCRFALEYVHSNPNLKHLRDCYFQTTT